MEPAVGKERYGSKWHREPGSFSAHTRPHTLIYTQSTTTTSSSGSTRSNSSFDEAPPLASFFSQLTADDDDDDGCVWHCWWLPGTRNLITFGAHTTHLAEVALLVQLLFGFVLQLADVLHG